MQALWKVDATGIVLRRFRARARRGAGDAGRVRLFETQIRNKRSVSHQRLADGSKRDNVVMVLLLAFWRWLLPAPAMQAPWPLAGVIPTAAFAVQRRRQLAPIPAPLRRLLS
jgi:hypothetical protein